MEEKEEEKEEEDCLGGRPEVLGRSMGEIVRDNYDW